MLIGEEQTHWFVLCRVKRAPAAENRCTGRGIAIQLTGRKTIAPAPKHPMALNMSLILRQVCKRRARVPMGVQKYDFFFHCRADESGSAKKWGIINLKPN